MSGTHVSLNRRIPTLFVCLVLAVMAAVLAVLPETAFAAPSISEDKLYRIVSVSNPSVVVEFDANAPGPGARARMAATDGAAHQVFTFASAGDGSYYIRSYYDPAVLLTANSLSVRGDVGAAYASSSKSQRWMVEEQSDGTLHIVAKGSPMMLDTNGATTQQGAACIMWFDNGGKTQKWTLQEVSAGSISSPMTLPKPSAVSGQYYRIVSVCTPSVIVELEGDSPANGALARMAAPDNGDNQLFELVQNADGTFTFKNHANSTLVLTANSLSVRGAVSGSAVTSGKAQRWIIKSVSGGYQLLSADNPGMMLDTNGATTQAGAACIMWFDNGGTTQKWTFQGVDSGGSVTPIEPDDPAEVEPDIVISSTKLYQIVSVSNPNVVLQLNAPSPVEGTKATLAVPDNSAKQVFTIEKQTDGTYLIRSHANTQLVLTANSLAVRGAVSGMKVAAGKAQSWKFKAVAPGVYHIVSTAAADRMLDTTGATTMPGSEAIMWFDNGGTTQEWTLREVGIDDPEAPVSPFPDSSSGALYRIVSVSNPGVVLQLDANMPVSGTNANMAAPNGKASQVFKITPKGGDTYTITSYANGSVLLTAESLSLRGNVGGAAAASGKAQTWRIEMQDDGSFHIVSTANPRYMLDTNGATTQAGANAIMWTNNGGDTQKWTFEVVDPSSIVSIGLPDSTDGTLYRIVNVANPSVVLALNADMPEAGEKVIVETANNHPNQIFTVTPDANGVYVITSYANTALRVTAHKLAMRGTVLASVASPSRAQSWRLEPTDTAGQYRIVNTTDDDYMLDVNGAYPQSGALCILWDNNGGDTQKWTFEAVDAGDVYTGAKMPDSSDGTVYRIVNVSNPSAVVAVEGSTPAEGANVQMSAVAASAMQAFTFDIQTDGSYIIRSYADSNLVLTVDALTVQGGVSLHAVDASLEQAWIIQRTSDDKFHIVAKGDTTWMLDTTGSVTATDSDCIMWFDNGGKTQKWTFAEVDTSTLP
ncbi:MAG: RICIN domain-containing protein [Eggerthellaceae bacterium]|nr:RICIN domain-containing protein [Eggerthellaceae bacterium]